MHPNSCNNPAFEDDTGSCPFPIVNSTESSTTPTATTVNELEMEEVTTLAPSALVGDKTNGSLNDQLTSLPLRISSPPAFMENAALCVRNAYKSYRKGTPVLSNFEMTVPSGAIYTLLGSSGSGKSTILNCCVGIRQLDRGEIFVFGHTPGTRESGVPGRRIGFMPQELSLYGELTIQETLNYFGRIYGMKRDQIFESSAFLIDFLDLPKAKRRVGTLSGGQKRRVSIAISLVHDPELLILDEPTVGCDALLREVIWNHLVKLVTTGRSTVIITTHYVEEARQSNVIGIIRNGRLLTEKSPQALVNEFKMDFLEDIVLSLCRMDREDRKNITNHDPEEIIETNQNANNTEDGEKLKLEWKISSSTNRQMEPNESTVVEDGNVHGLRYAPSTVSFTPDRNGKGPGDTKMPFLSQSQLLTRRRKLSTRENIRQNKSTFFTRLRALLIKNFIILMRNIGFLIFIFLVPAIQVILICLTIGSDPKGLLISVITAENCDFEGDGWRRVIDTCPVSSTKQNSENGTLSCFYLAHLPKESFILERAMSETEALRKIQKGYTYGYVQFPENYTQNVICRFGDAKMCKNGRNPDGNIIIELDMSNKQIGQTMKRIFVDAYGKAMDQIKVNCESKVSSTTLQTAANVPYTFKKPIYGKDDTSFREFLAPSILLGLLFFFPLCSSGVSYITEKKTGTLDRALVAGVGTTEFMGGFLISQVGILLGQAGFSFLILTQVFQIEILGSITLALLLTILVGVSGMSAGFLLAMFCSEEVQAVLLAIGTFFPNILLAGMVWPLEGMDRTLQYVSYLLPCTLACESMRSIISRGWNFAHRNVWPGFLSTFAWIVVYWVLAVLVHRFRNRG